MKTVLSTKNEKNISELNILIIRYLFFYFNKYFLLLLLIKKIIVHLYSINSSIFCQMS
jgi:hypothetical protein